MNVNDTENMQAILDHPLRWSGFTAQLFRLICKADMDNRAKLAIVFPDEVKAVCDHRGRGHPDPGLTVVELLHENTQVSAVLRELLAQLDGIGIPKGHGAEGLDLEAAREAVQ